MKRIALVLALSTIAISAQASELDYNYAQASYVGADIDGTSLDGFGLNGSFKFNDDFYGIAGYQQTSKGSVELSEFDFGLGFRKNIHEGTDWVSELSWIRNTFDYGPYSTSNNGYRIATGVRSMVSEQFELNGKINYTNVSNFGNGFGVGVGGVYHFNDTFGVGIGFDYADRDTNLNSWNIGARLNF